MKNFLNLANSLSVLRILLSIPLYYSIKKITNISSYYDSIVFLLICLLIGLTDILDGYFARKYNVVTDIGKFLDPLADKICIFVLIIFLSINFGLKYSVLFTLLIIRDLIISFFSIYYVNLKGKYLQANVFGKCFLFLISLHMLIKIFTIPDIIASDFDYLIYFDNYLYILSFLFFIIGTMEYFSLYIKIYKDKK
tara:strand:+ start:1484 stop:2068 length:585 start_codon:yes stop_codon:yes gene_type:complete